MSLFLRRQLQQCLDDLDGRLPAAVLASLVKHLNGKKDRPLSAEWEVMLLWGLSRTLDVDYEPGHPNAVKLDLVVCRPGERSPLFSADVRTVSDHGYHSANPVERFSDLVTAAKIEAKLPGGVSWTVEGFSEGPYRNAKRRAHLPVSDVACERARERILSFFKACRAARRARVLDLSDLAMGLNVSFDPHGRGLSGSYPGYSSTYSVRRNTVANHLWEKRAQLKDARAAGLIGTILCDGGCQLIRERYVAPGEVSLREVVLTYLKEAPEVDFVVALGIDSHYRSTLHRSETHTIRPQMFTLRSADRVEPVREAIEYSVSRLPSPVTSGENARAWYLKGVGNDGYRRQPMSFGSEEVSISARTLIELLAGRTSIEEAMHRCGTPENAMAGQNPFRRMLESGRLPERVELVRDEEMDDDAVVFRFGKPDPAIARFKAP